MCNIVGVQFQNRDNPDAFGGREYNYFAAIPVSVGDIVVVPTSGGDGIARVISIDVPESKIDERIFPFLKTIEKLFESEGESCPARQ